MSTIRDLLIRRHSLEIRREDEKSLTAADLRAVAAYLESLSIAPQTCTVIIGGLRLSLEVDE